jgi:crotonobetainyl-CoA:carnitine CoA-transferase CaiB-like acyl-CoA transferase
MHDSDVARRGVESGIAMKDETKQPQGPLRGCRVLELGSTIAGPFCGRLLADFGAEVIKVEDLEGDPVRAMGKRHEGVSLYAASIFRNKRLIALDLRRAESQEVVRKLAASCDVVVENFRPGGLEKWGIGYEHLRRVRQDLIMARISGFGQDGPYSHRPGFGIIGEAVSGLRHLTGDPDRPPARVAVSLTDYITGLYAAFGIVMAVLERKSTGQGQLIDASLFESAFSFMEPFVPAFDKLGDIPTRAGPALPGHAPNTLYKSGDGSYVHIAAASQSLFRRLVDAMGRSDLIEEERFNTPVQRGQNSEALDAIIGDWTGRHTVEEIESILIDKAEVPAARVYTIADIFRDAHFKARNMLKEVADQDIGNVKLANVVPKLSGSPGEIRWSGRRIGQDTRHVLKTLGGYSNDAIDKLAASGAIACGRQP